jgi:competence protein ComEC
MLQPGSGAVLGFVLGIALASLYPLARPLLYFIALGGGLFLLAYFRRREYGSYLLIALIGLGFVFGAARLQWAERRDHRYDPLVGQSVSFNAQVVTEPSRREKSTQLVVRPAGSDSKFLLIVPLYPEYQFGQSLRVEGKLSQPENFETTAGREFDYQNYLAKDDIYYQLIFPQITVVESPPTLRGSLYQIKQRFLESLARALPEPHAALLGGITIGAKEGLDQATNDLFRTVGLSHVVVLSGYNITIVAESVAKVLTKLPRMWGAGLGALAVIIFIIMTGASSTAIRAGVMALVALLGRVTGREYDSLRALGVAGLLMLVWNPRLLVFDLSFQLSFLATLGVIVGPPVLTSYLKWVPARFGLRETLATTLAAQIVVLPWIIYKMGQLSLVALPVNLLVLPLVPLTMLAGSLLGLVGSFSYSLSLPLGYLAYLPLAWFLGVTKLFAVLPFAAVIIPPLNFIFIGAVYAALVILYRWLGSRKIGA